jgi:hypothetical protein
MCLTALKDLEKSSVEAIMELAFPSSKNPMTHPAYSHTSISRSRSLPSMNQSPEPAHRGHLHRSASGDVPPGMDISALARSEVYSDILDAEEEALGLTPHGGGIVQVTCLMILFSSYCPLSSLASVVTFESTKTKNSQQWQCFQSLHCLICSSCDLSQSQRQRKCRRP